MPTHRVTQVRAPAGTPDPPPTLCATRHLDFGGCVSVQDTAGSALTAAPAPPGHQGGSRDSSQGWEGRTHLAEWPREALGAVTAEAAHQVLTDTGVAGAAGTLVQLQLAVPAAKAPRARALVAAHKVLGQAEGQTDGRGWASVLRQPGRHLHPTPFPSVRRGGAPAAAHLAGAPVPTLPVTVVVFCGQRMRSGAGPWRRPSPPACGPPPVLTDVAVEALPAREAITVIATNQVFARESVKARLPFTLIGVCGGDKRAPWGPAPRAPAPGARSPCSPAAAAGCRARSACSHEAPPLTQQAGGPRPLLRADALEAVHTVHAGAARRARAGGALVHV